MRIGVVCLALLAIAAAPPKKAMPKAPPRAVFEFRGFKAGETVDPAVLAKCSKGEPVTCVEMPGKVADVEVTILSTSFYRGKLSRLKIYSDAIYFSVLTDAFKAKYGRPCASSVKRVQNRMGAWFNNPVMTWCFASGKLTAQMYGVSLDTSSFEYEDVNQAPDTPHPKVDF